MSLIETEYSPDIDISSGQEKDDIVMFNSFVRAMSSAIDARSPHNAEHTRNMVRFGERFIDWLGMTENAWRFSGRAREEFLLSVWLHDVGKLVTPHSVMDKDSRLGASLSGVLQRFNRIGLTNRIGYIEGRYGKDEYEAELAFLEDARELVESANLARILSGETGERLRVLGSRTYTDLAGTTRPYLTPSELESLLVRRGTLNEEERAVIQEHARMTERILSETIFPAGLKNVPKWAAMHHELLDGSGYPHKISGSAIPREARLLTILDIFEALTARRPYKDPLSIKKSFEVLEEMALEGKIDGDILALFRQSGAWESA